MQKLELIQSKIFESANIELTRLVAIWRFKTYKVVFTNGCFDILHRGHIDYLSKASELGDIFIIGLNSDKSDRRLKGPSRPIQDEYSRALILASLSFVDKVVIFDEDTPYELIKVVQPDILVKGGDYKPEEIAGYDIVTAKGGQVITLPFLEGYSTTAIENKIRIA